MQQNSDIMDLICIEKFGYPGVQSHDEIFNTPMFDEYRKMEEKRNKNFLNKDTEGTMGNCRFKDCDSKVTFLVEKQRCAADEAKNLDVCCAKCGRTWAAK